MPVECMVEVDPVGQERFHAVDRVVMRHVFGVHNALGRFCDERVYQEELARHVPEPGQRRRTAGSRRMPTCRRTESTGPEVGSANAASGIVSPGSEAVWSSGFSRSCPDPNAEQRM